jgi:hypothetical protein
MDTTISGSIEENILVLANTILMRKIFSGNRVVDRTFSVLMTGADANIAVQTPVEYI